MVVSSLNPILAIVLPLVAAQYALAIFTLTRLALARFPIKIYVVWNIVILLAFFVGSIVFLIYYYTKRKKIGDAIIAEEDKRALNAKPLDEPTDNDSDKSSESKPE